MNYAESWKVDKDIKVPYATQLVKNIRWSIIMGEIRRTEKLPPIRNLAAELGISVNTVRSAYKQLEEEELVVTRPHHGTIVLSATPEKDMLEKELAIAIKDALHSGLEIEDARRVCERVFLEAANLNKQKRAIFVDTHEGMAARYIKQIEEAVHIQVEAVQLKDLPEYLELHAGEMDQMDAIITTYFYYAQVQAIANIYRPMVCGMAVEVSQRMTGALQGLESGALVGVVCDQGDSRMSLVNLLAGIRGDVQYEICCSGETERLAEFAKLADIVCVTPLSTLEAGEAVSPVPVYEIWDRINEQSMNMFRNYLR